jgi:hypothetical protein
MLKWTKTEKLVKSGENQIFMACLDAHLYENEYILILFSCFVYQWMLKHMSRYEF